MEKKISGYTIRTDAETWKRFRMLAIAYDQPMAKLFSDMVATLWPMDNKLLIEAVEHTNARKKEKKHGKTDGSARNREG
jgi:hypothetical protein